MFSRLKAMFAVTVPLALALLGLTATEAQNLADRDAILS
jgi:hypothetical protein